MFGLFGKKEDQKIQLEKIREQKEKNKNLYRYALDLYTPKTSS